jgi:hypothetical protein
MWHGILLGTAAYSIGAGMLTCWLGGIFLHQRPALCLLIDPLHSARE